MKKGDVVYLPVKITAVAGKWVSLKVEDSAGTAYLQVEKQKLLPPEGYSLTTVKRS